MSLNNLASNQHVVCYDDRTEGGAMMSDFHKWFDAQYVDDGVSRWRKMTVQQLTDAARDGQDAAYELQRRIKREAMERAALHAWNYLMTLPEPPECP